MPAARVERTTIATMSARSSISPAGRVVTSTPSPFSASATVSATSRVEPCFVPYVTNSPGHGGPPLRPPSPVSAFARSGLGRRRSALFYGCPRRHAGRVPPNDSPLPSSRTRRRATSLPRGSLRVLGARRSRRRGPLRLRAARFDARPDLVQELLRIRRQLELAARDGDDGAPQDASHHWAGCSTSRLRTDRRIQAIAQRVERATLDRPRRCCDTWSSAATSAICSTSRRARNAGSGSHAGAPGGSPRPCRLPAPARARPSRLQDRGPRRPGSGLPAATLPSRTAWSSETGGVPAFRVAVTTAGVRPVAAAISAGVGSCPVAHLIRASACSIARRRSTTCFGRRISRD